MPVKELNLEIFEFIQEKVKEYLAEYKACPPDPDMYDKFRNLYDDLRDVVEFLQENSDGYREQYYGARTVLEDLADVIDQFYVEKTTEAK